MPIKIKYSHTLGKKMRTFLKYAFFYPSKRVGHDGKYRKTPGHITRCFEFHLTQYPYNLNGTIIFLSKTLKVKLSATNKLTVSGSADS